MSCSKQTFLQRHTDGQETHEKMLNIIEKCKEKVQGPHSSHNGHHQKNLQTVNTGEEVEKREPDCMVGGNVNWYRYSHYGEYYGDSLKN